MDPTAHVVVAGAARTPIGRFGGGLSSLTAADLGVSAAEAALARSGIEAAQIDEAIIGCARQAGTGPNVARQIAYRAGVPQEVPAFTINMACGSGLKAIDLGYRAIRDGDAGIVLAAGVESMSNVPYLLTQARWGYRMGSQEVVDGMYRDGFLCPLAEMIMGETAERLTQEFSIAREEQDGFAVRSQEKAEIALKEGRFVEEIVPVDVKGSRATRRVASDEHPWPQTSLASLGRLRPVFKQDGGSVTAGNSSGITDGGAAVVLLSERRAEALRIRPLARILGVASAGVDPHVMGIGVVPAVRRLLDRIDLGLADFDLIEVNEAFAAQVIACDRELGFDPEKLNVNGGAIALGHPIGATGARISVTLLYELKRRGARRGLATLCISGGMGMAVAYEMV